MPATQIPKRSPGTRAKAGYVCEFSPLVSERYLSYDSSTAAWTCRGEGRWPVETYRPLLVMCLLPSPGPSAAGFRCRSRRGCLIYIIDLVFVKKDAEGNITTFEIR
jgi:hypothetical protein